MTSGTDSGRRTEAPASIGARLRRLASASVALSLVLVVVAVLVIGLVRGTRSSAV